MVEQIRALPIGETDAVLPIQLGQVGTRFRVGAKGPSPVTVVLEPSGAEYVLQLGDYMGFEWEDEPGQLAWTVDHAPDLITVGQGIVQARMLNSHGEEMSMLG